MDDRGRLALYPLVVVPNRLLSHHVQRVISTGAACGEVWTGDQPARARAVTGLQRRFSGIVGLEMDAEGLIRLTYNATGGASEATGRRGFSPIGHQRDTRDGLNS
jgi:hypothetical protein